MTIADDVAASMAAPFAKHAPLPLSPSVRPGRAEGFDFQCDDALPAGAKSGMPPRLLADAVAAELSSDPMYSAVSVTGPGFVNLRLSDVVLLRKAAEMAASRNLGVPDVGNGKRTSLDFGGPNIAKPLHVGHLRSFVLGESIRRILVETGHAVVSDIHLGDWGLQMGMLLMEAMRLWPEAASGEVPDGLDTDSLESLYRAASEACAKDEDKLAEARRWTQALQSGDSAARGVWNRMREISLAEISAAAGTLGAHFDLFLGESDADSDIEPMVADLLARGLARESDGAVVIGGDAETGKPPLILRKSDGAALYGSTDLATLRRRTEVDGAKSVVYVVDRRQSQHLSSVFEAAMAAGYADGAELLHAGFGTVNGKDRKPFKTRSGGTARLSDLIDEAVGKARARLEEGGMEPEAASAMAGKVGLGALKFADLASDRLTGYVFDPDRMTSFEGKTGPYLQYACVRIRAIMEKAQGKGVASGGALAAAHPAERQLVVECLRFPDSVAEAARRMQPMEVADRAFQVAQAFSRFYVDCPVAKDGEEASESRLALCAFAGQVIERCLYLLGIEVPERM